MRIPKGLPASKSAKDAIGAAFQHHIYTFPTLSIRQGHILLTLIEAAIHDHMEVDGKVVTADEWIELIKTLVDVRS